MSKVHYIRFLPKGVFGIGQITHAASFSGLVSIDRYKRLYPYVFEKEGFYTILIGGNSASITGEL